MIPEVRCSEGKENYKKENKKGCVVCRFWGEFVYFQIYSKDPKLHYRVNLIVSLSVTLYTLI